MSENELMIDLFGDDDVESSDDEEHEGNDEEGDGTQHVGHASVEHHVSTDAGHEPMRGAGQQPVILGYIPPEGTVYAQPRTAPARTAWNGAMNAFIRIDRSDTRRNGAGPHGYVWCADIVGYRRTEEQTVTDERNLANRSANGRNGTHGRDIVWYGIDVPGGTILEFSGYCGAQGHHAPLRWFDWLEECFTSLCDHDGSAFALGQERGDRRRLLHFQWILRIITTEANIERLRRHIRNALHIVPGANMRCKISIKLFNNQSWNYMLGYCQKDSGQAHYRFAKYGVTNQETEQGRQEYASVIMEEATSIDIFWAEWMEHYYAQMLMNQVP